MIDNVHRLLKRQISKHIKPEHLESDEAKAFLTAVNEAYSSFEEDHKLLERTLEISSNELFKVNLELDNAKGELEQLVTDLRDTQTQLVQSEKMASLGQLTAGIAHELNNPINFVTNSINPLKRDIERIINLLKMYEELQPGITKEILDRIQAYREEIDFDYTVEEINSLLSGMDEGAKRTSNIVRGLKNFSRLDEAEHKKANINDCIESTLILLQHIIKHSALEISKELAPLPEIECYPGQLNQVLMNILTNAMQAVGEKGKIHIKTSLITESCLHNAKNYVVVSIKDNGPGIPTEIIDKIFNPFFTTKDVGQGTGLGLSISYGIIQKHHGKIEVLSGPGSGAEFIITLPNK